MTPQQPEPRIGERFGLDPNARKLYYTYLLIPALLLACLIVLAVSSLIYFAVPEYWIVALGLAVPYLAVVGSVAYWISKYLPTVGYTLAADRVVFEGGVWWKRKSFVPYNRITNIDIIQGPLSRHFGLGKVSIQTAGYSGQPSSGVRFAEISIFGVKDFESIKDAIMGMIVRSRPVAVEAGVETTHVMPDAEILEELRRIRKGIESLASRQ